MADFPAEPSAAVTDVRTSLSICFLVSFSVSMSASLTASPSLDNCLCVVVVDLPACREPSKGAVASHDHETVGGGRRARRRAVENRRRPKPMGSSLRAAHGDHIDRLVSAAGGGPQTARKRYELKAWNVLKKRLGGLWNLLGRSWDAGISSWAIFGAPGVLLKPCSALLKTSGALCTPFGHFLGRLGGLLGPS